MKFFNTPYPMVMAMPVHRFFLLIDEIGTIEWVASKKIIKKKLESKDDFTSFFFGQ